MWAVVACGATTAQPHDLATTAGSSVAGASASASATGGSDSLPQGSAPAAAAGPSAGGSSTGGLAAGGEAQSDAGEAPVGGGAGGSPSIDPPVPSPGCALGRAEGPANDGTVIYRLPQGYDGVTPLPLIFTLHATNIFNDVTRLTTDERSRRYVLAGPKASSPLGTFEEGTPDIEPRLTKVLSEVCVDESRVFGAGNGSGGRVLMDWIRRRDKTSLAAPRIRAAAIVGTFYGSFSSSPLPLVFIHPTQSNNSRAVASDEDGTKALALLKRLNVCGDASSPVDAAGCGLASAPIDPGCVDYEDCAAPLRFCHHNDLGGQSAGDPWSCVATPAIFDFFEPLRGSSSASSG